MGEKGGDSRRDLEGLPSFPPPTHTPYSRLSPEAPKVWL